MGISTIGAAGASGLTDEGGEVVLSRFISGDAYISTSDLPAGSYYFTFAGAGLYKIRPYDASQKLSAPLLTGTNTAKTTRAVTIPNSASGIFITGGYSGPIIVQTLTSGAPAEITSSVWQKVWERADTATWTKFVSSTSAPSNKFFTITSSGATSATAVADASTGDVTTGSIGYRNNSSGTWAGGGATYSEFIETSQGTLIISGGYGGGGVGAYVYRSTDGGATWSNVKTLWDTTYSESAGVLADGTIYISAAKDGYGSRRAEFTYSTDEGATWTDSAYPGGNNGYYWGKMAYVNGYYVIFSGRTDSQQSQVFANQTFYSTDLSTWTQVNAPYTIDCTVLAEFNGKAYAIGRVNSSYVRVLENSTGTSWSSVATVTSWTDSPSRAQRGGFRSYTVTKDANGNDEYLYFASEYFSQLYRLDTSNTAGYVSSGITFSPFSTGYTAAYLDTINNGTTLICTYYQWQNYGWHEQAARTRVGGFVQISPSDSRNYLAFYSTQFNRWYTQNQNYQWYIGDADGSYAFSAGLVPNQASGYRSNMVEGDGYIAFMQYGYLFKSTDGATWTKTAHPNYYNVQAYSPNMAYYNGKLLYCPQGSNDSYYSVSSDGGVTWTNTNLYNTSSSANAWYPVSFDDGFVLISTQNSSVWYSTDAIVWTRDTNADIQISTYQIDGANSFGTLMCTNSGSTGSYKRMTGLGSGATNQTGPYSNYLQLLKVGENYIAMLTGSRLSTTNFNYYWTSPNGITWTQQSAKMDSRNWSTPLGASQNQFVINCSNGQANYGGYATTLQELEETLTLG